MFIDCDLLDQVTTLDANFLRLDEMLNDDISHVLPVGVPFLVQSVNGRENQLVVGDGTIVAPNRLNRVRKVFFRYHVIFQKTKVSNISCVAQEPS